MGCCLTKDVNVLHRKRANILDKNVKILSKKLLKCDSYMNQILVYSEMLDKDILIEKYNEPKASWEFNIPQIKELHAIWLLSMLKQLRSEQDTVFILTQLIEIMELLNPYDGRTKLRKHMYESGATEVLCNIIKYNTKSPEILLLCILILIHLLFNDGVSENIIAIAIPQILELFNKIENESWSESARNSILLALFRLIFLSSSDSKLVSEIWVDSNIGKKIIYFLSERNLNENVQGWGFAALRFLVGSNREACKEFMSMGLFNLAASKLDNCFDKFLIENILALFVSVLMTLEEFTFNDPNIIRKILEIIKANIHIKQIVKFGFILLILSCKRTEIYSHVISAYDINRVVRSINQYYKREKNDQQVIILCKQLYKIMSRSHSKTTSIGLINNKLVYSNQRDPNKYGLLRIECIGKSDPSQIKMWF
ncbi:hypothetical protein FG386_003674 [Cryptosporidium ryanae]|uniref:uncharacterized protein n=1 Tax=Cryptosporidium ryanae TaxID=515981 RepID=UPI00351A0546|nr:hypothetical protein FG386_003674 [Cryptosporidium ryanae]